jgi:hypothetical protein
MAEVAGAPWTVAFVLEDGEDHTAEVGFNLDGGATFGEAQDFAEAMGPVLSAITLCGVRSARVSRLSNTWTPGPGDGDIEAGAQFVFGVEGTTKTLRVTIPAFEPTAFVANSDKVNESNAAVTAFRNAMVTGLAGVLPRDSETRQLTGIKYAVESWGKKRKNR